MKTALDLPDELAREVKILAARQGRKMKDVIADLLRRGLESTAATAPTLDSQLSVNPVTGLPMIVCRHPARGARRLTPDRVAEILLEQEIVWSNETR